MFSTYSITDERKQMVDFAGPYFVAHQDLLVRRNEEEITGPETLNGRVLCSVAGTTSAATVKEKYKGTIDLKEYPKFSDCVAALADSEVDAVTTDDVILAGFAAEAQYRGKLRVVGKGFSDEQYGVGIKKGDTAMVDKVNAALKQYIADGSWKKSLEHDRRGRPATRSPSPPTPGHRLIAEVQRPDACGSMRPSTRRLAGRSCAGARSRSTSLDPASRSRRSRRPRVVERFARRRADPRRVHRPEQSRCSS